mgnify:CR=1 FL=1
MATFQERLIQAMKIREMRQVDVAKKSGLPKAQISQYKSGKYEPMQDALYKIAKALSVNVEWLMGHDVPMEEHDISQLFHRLTATDQQKVLDIINAMLKMYT